MLAHTALVLGGAWDCGQEPDGVLQPESSVLHGPWQVQDVFHDAPNLLSLVPFHELSARQLKHSGQVLGERMVPPDGYIL